MSVIVKGMNVPDTCGDCCLYSHIDNVCQYDNTDMNYDDNRPPWCPLVETHLFPTAAKEDEQDDE